MLAINTNNEQVKLTWTCDSCNKTMNSSSKSKHLKTESHLKKINNKKPEPQLIKRWQVRDWLVETLYTLLQPVECKGVSESVYDYLVDWWFEQSQPPTPQYFCTRFKRMLKSNFDLFMTMQTYLYNKEVCVHDIAQFFTCLPKPSAPVLRTLVQEDKQKLTQLVDQMFGTMAWAGIDSNVYDYIFNWWEKTFEPPTFKQVEEILVKIRDGKLWGYEDCTLEVYLIKDKLCASDIEWAFPESGVQASD